MQLYAAADDAVADALRPLLESVTGTTARSPALYVSAPGGGLCRRAPNKTDALDAMLAQPNGLYRHVRFRVPKNARPPSWWRRLTAAPELASERDWFCTLVQAQVQAHATAVPAYTVTTDPSVPVTYTLVGLDGAPTVELTVTNPHVPWFAFAREVGKRVERPVELRDLSTPCACLYYDARGRQPVDLLGTLVTNPVVETTLYWREGQPDRTTNTTTHSKAHGGAMLLLFSVLMTVMYAVHHSAAVASVLSAVYSHRFLFAHATAKVAAVTTGAYHHVAPFVTSVAHVAAKGAHVVGADAAKAAKAVKHGTEQAAHVVAPGIRHAVEATKHGVHEAAHAVAREAKVVAQAAAPVVTKVEHGASKAAHAVEHGASKAAHAVEHGASKAAHAVAREAKVVAQAAAPVVSKVEHGASKAARAVAHEAEVVAAAVKGTSKQRGGGRRPVSVLVPLDVVSTDDADGQRSPDAYFGLVASHRGKLRCEAVLQMPAEAFDGYPPDFYLCQHLLLVYRVVRLVTDGEYREVQARAVEHLSPADRKPVAREMAALERRVKGLVRKYRLPASAQSPLRLLEDACCGPNATKRNANCKGYTALFRSTLRRSDLLSKRGDVRCEALRRTRRR